MGYATAFEVEDLRSEVLNVVEGSFEQAVNLIAANAVSGVNAATINAAKIPGLRSQIIANASFLVKYNEALRKSTSLTINGDAVATGEVQLITLGEEPQVRACIFSGTTLPVKLLHSDPKSDTAEALDNLLQKTQKMLSIDLTKTAAKRTKASSHVSTTFATQVMPASASNGNISAAVKKAPASSFNVFSKTSKVKVDSKMQATGGFKVKHERKLSSSTDPGFWDAGAINNGSFQMDDGQDDGYDSGFTSRDGEPHPNRSYVVDIAGAQAARAMGMVPSGIALADMGL